MLKSLLSTFAVLTLGTLSQSANAGIISGYYDSTGAIDTTPNTSIAGVSSSLTAASVSGEGSADETYGNGASTGEAGNTVNSYVELVQTLTGALLKVTNSSSGILSLSTLLFDYAKLSGTGDDDIKFGVTQYTSSSSFVQFSPGFVDINTLNYEDWTNYSFDLTGFTLNPGDYVEVQFGSTNPDANHRLGLDNIAIDGSLALTAVPETSTLLGLGAFFGLASSARFRRRSTVTAAA